jgi:hypothetical protein
MKLWNDGDISVSRGAKAWPPVDGGSLHDTGVVTAGSRLQDVILFTLQFILADPLLGVDEGVSADPLSQAYIPWVPDFSTQDMVDLLINFDMYTTSASARDMYAGTVTPSLSCILAMYVNSIPILTLLMNTPISTMSTLR